MFLSDPRDTAFTFGEPGGNDGFAQVLSSLGDRIKINAGRTLEEDVAAQRSYAEDVGRAARAAERQTRLVDTINARESALAEAADNRIRTVQQATGVQLENPFSGGYLIEANRRVDDARARGEVIDNRSARVQDEQRRIFTERLDEAAQNHPDQAAALTFYQPLEEQAQAIAKGAAYDGEHAPGGAGALLGSLAGGIWGSRRDPLFVGSLFAGPAMSTAKTVLGRIGMGALKQGLFNAGLQAAAQPAVQDWRRELGERNGVAPALENVGLAFLFGAIPGAAFEGGKALLSTTARGALERISTGAAEPGDIGTAASALGVKLDPQTEATVQTAAADLEHGTLAAGPAPDGLPAGFAADAERQAVRHAEDPVSQPPPELASPPVASPDVAGAERAVSGADAPAAAAEALRADPALIEGALHSGDPQLAAAGRLATLSDGALGMVRDGQAAPEHAAIVASLSPDPIYDGPVLARVTDLKPATPEEARLIAAEGIEAEARRMEAVGASRLVDAYHGSPFPFTEFDPARAPYYFTPHHEVALEYANTTYAEGFAALRGKVVETTGKQPHVVAARLKMEKPFIADMWDFAEAAKARDPNWLRQNGYDSAILTTKRDPLGTEYLVLSREQILPRQAVRAATDTPTVVAPPSEPPKVAAAMPDGTRRDVMDLVPMLRDDGSVMLATREAVAAIGDEQAGLAALVRACNL
jgi:hypothetical protein